MKKTMLLILSCCIQYLCIAQSNSLTLEDIYTKNKYAAKGFGPLVFMKDNKGYTTLEYNASFKSNEIILYDIISGSKKVLVSAKQLIPNGLVNPLSIYNYTWSNDNKNLLIYTNTKKVWRQNTKGDYWVLNIATGMLSQIGKTLPSASLMFAKFSPNGKEIAYVSNLNIYKENLATHAITQISFDGGGDIINGTFDWVYEEELDDRDGFRWSSDSKEIAYWQSNTKGVGTFYLINNVDSIYSKPIPLPYPKVGTPNSAVKLGVVSANGGKTRWLNLPGDPRNNYIARMDYVPGKNELIIQQLNRLQNTNRVWIANTNSLALTNIYTDTDEAFLNIHDNIVWLENSNAFTWTSEKDGWLHLYKISKDGKAVSLITKGNFDVVNINYIDTTNGYVYYIASPENYLQRYLYRSKLDGTGNAERVTPANLAGQNSYQLSGDAKYAIHVFENAQTPKRYSLISLPDHHEIKLLEENSNLKNNIAALGLRPKEFFKVDIGEVVFDAWVIKPINFDPQKKYPTIFHVYGEPASSTVQDNWGTGDNLWHQYLANQGYIIISVDNRGTKVPRGRAWRKIIYRQIGLLAADDQAKAAQKICSLFPFVDASRLGIWGWSGGGQMSLHSIFRHGDVFKTAIAVSFVSQQTLYDNIYQERYMGLPTDNVEGYREGSPVTHAKKLQGSLLIIHGTADDNVHYQNFELLVNELVKNNKLFSMMSYPMRDHGINQRENTTLHMRRTMEQFWKKNL